MKWRKDFLTEDEWDGYNADDVYSIGENDHEDLGLTSTDEAFMQGYVEA